MTALRPGLLLQRRYVLHDRIGAGGMAEVWQAADEVLRRPVAVKVLVPALAADPALRAGVQAEARAVARLDHPHITRVYDYGEATLPDGTPLCYLVMELVDGQTLAARLAYGPLPWPPAVRSTGQVAAALAAAHRSGLVHRDIKPGNVMLTADGAKVLDFGIAAVTRPTFARPDAAPGSVRPGFALPPDGDTAPPPVGTPAYAAPEWLAAAPPDPAADVYGLGALLYESLTDQPAVRARSWAEAARVHRHAAPLTPPDVPGLPATVRELCMACLSPDPAMRPRAAEVAEALGGTRTRPRGARRRAAATPRTAGVEPGLDSGRTTIDGGAAATVPGETIATPPHPAWYGRPVTLRVLLAALVLAAIVGLGLGLWMLSPPQDASGAPDPVGVAPGVRMPALTGTASPTPASPTPAASRQESGVPPAPTPRAALSPAGTRPVQPRPVQSRPGATLTEVVDEFQRQLDRATTDARVRQDVAVDIGNELEALRRHIDAGEVEQLGAPVNQLLRKLDDRQAERAIEPEVAESLSALLRLMLP